MINFLGKTVFRKTEGTSQTWGQAPTTQNSIQPESTVGLGKESSVVENMQITSEDTVSESGFDRSNPFTDNNLDFILSEGKNVESTAKTLGEIQKSLEESQKVNLLITLKSKESESIDYNSLVVPHLNAKFVYNFFVGEEQDVLTQEDQSLDPLFEKSAREVPRYVELTWDAVSITEKLTGEEANETEESKTIKQNFLVSDRGVVNSTGTELKKSVENSSKRNNPIIVDGRQAKLVDSHRPQQAFDSVANKRQFANSIQTVVNTSKNNQRQIDLNKVVANTTSSLNKKPSLTKQTGTTRPGGKVVDNKAYVNRLLRLKR